jgi:hypothetical protein
MPYCREPKLGRNDPCTCGSGRKYKQCCLNTPRIADQSPSKQQQDASGLLISSMLQFVRREFVQELEQAWQDFNLDPNPVPIDEDQAEGQIFVPYLLFDWDPNRSRSSRKPQAGLVAQAYLVKNEKHLSDLERSILIEAFTRPLSFYEVLSTRPGESMSLRDVLIGGELEVTERTASQHCQPGDIVFAQIWELEGLRTFGRLAPLYMPPDRKVSVVALRAKLRKKIAKQNRGLTAADLLRYREEVRGIYLDVRDAMRTPPTLTNTDRELFVPHTLTFRTASAHVAFEALAPLAKGVTKQELLSGAQVGSDGVLESVELPWQKLSNRVHKDWDSTVLGIIRISGRSLVVEVNSQARAERIKNEIDKRLGILATHLKTETHPFDPAEAMRQPMNCKQSEAPLVISEEMREEMRKMAESWVLDKVPALGGCTPMEAVQDPDGREIVEGLLKAWERNGQRAESNIIRPDVKTIRRLLQLDS